MSEQIIGHDCDGKPIPAGALVSAVNTDEVKGDYADTQFRVLRRATEDELPMLNFVAGEGNHLQCDDGMFILDHTTRLVKDDSKDDEQHHTDHTPADDDFQAKLKQWLGQEQESKV